MAKRKTLKIGKLTIQQRESGTYRVRIEIEPENGKRRWLSLSDPDPHVLIEKVLAYQATRQTASKLTFGKAMDEYIQTCELAGHSPSTIVGYKRIRRTGIGALAEMHIDKITLPDVQRQINLRAKTCSPKTVINEYGLIHKVLSIYAPRLSFSGIVLPSNKNKVNRDAGVEIPTDEQMEVLLHAAREKDDELYRAILLGGVVGLRRSEICALTWSDLDQAAGTLSITKATVKGTDRDFHLKSTKTTKGERTVNISASLVNILLAYQTTPDDRIVHLSPDAVTRRFERLRDPLGIPGRFHDLRHYHCSTMVALGAPREYIMADMGHSTDTMYRKVYTHMMPETRSQIYEKLASHTDKILNCDQECDPTI